MPVKEIPTADLLRLPWSRTVASDEDDVWVASVPELEGCFAEGNSVEEALANLERVLKEWLEIALEDGVDIPRPRRLAAAEFSGRFSVRVPRSLHSALTEWAAEEGSSLNQLLVAVLSDACGRRAAHGASDARRVEDAYEHIAAAAVAPASESIGALKGIAAYLRQDGAINLACVTFAAAADRVARYENPGRASRELGVTAALARRENRLSLAEALWRASLDYDAANLRSLSALGQLLHHNGRYEEAVEYLEPAAQRDNYALQFLGWSLLEHGLQIEDGGRMERGLRTLVQALERWALGNTDADDRVAWVRQVRRLAQLRPGLRDHAVELVEFANRNSGWPRVSYDDVLAQPGTDSSDPPAYAADAAGK